MEKLTEQQKQQLIQHMNRHDNDSFAAHAHWAQQQFGVQVTERECQSAFMDSMFG